MPTVQINIACDNAVDAVHEMTVLLNNAGVRTFSADELDKLAADKVQAGYDAGVRDGRSEAKQEHAMATGIVGIAGMIAHDTVSVSVQQGHLPFNFQPAMLTTFGRLTPNKQEALGDGAIGTPRNTLGVYGFNMLSRKPMFLTRVDHWTLAPAENKS